MEAWLQFARVRRWEWLWYHLLFLIFICVWLIWCDRRISSLIIFVFVFLFFILTCCIIRRWHIIRGFVICFSCFLIVYITIVLFSLILIILCRISFFPIFLFLILWLYQVTSILVLRYP